MRASVRSSPEHRTRSARRSALDGSMCSAPGWRRRKTACRLRCRRKFGRYQPPGSAFHWPLEFPEVFHGKRPDPLDAEQTNKTAWMDGFVGNPPFVGRRASARRRRQIACRGFGGAEGARGNADLLCTFLPPRVPPSGRARHHRIHRHQHYRARRHPCHWSQVHSEQRSSALRRRALDEVAGPGRKRRSVGGSRRKGARLRLSARAAPRWPVMSNT